MLLLYREGRMRNMLEVCVKIFYYMSIEVEN